MNTARGFIYGPKGCEILARADRQQLLAALGELNDNDDSTNSERDQNAVEDAVDSSDCNLANEKSQDL